MTWNLAVKPHVCQTEFKIDHARKCKPKWSKHIKSISWFLSDSHVLFRLDTPTGTQELTWCVWARHSCCQWSVGNHNLCHSRQSKMFFSHFWSIFIDCAPKQAAPTIIGVMWSRCTLEGWMYMCLKDSARRNLWRVLNHKKRPKEEGSLKWTDTRNYKPQTISVMYHPLEIVIYPQLKKYTPDVVLCSFLNSWPIFSCLCSWASSSSWYCGVVLRKEETRRSTLQEVKHKRTEPEEKTKKRREAWNEPLSFAVGRNKCHIYPGLIPCRQKQGISAPTTEVNKCR